MSTTVTAALDPLPEATAGINLATEGLKVAGQVFAANNTDPMVHAAIEKHAQDAINRMQAAIAAGDVDALRRMGAI